MIVSRAKLQLFPDILADSVEFLALRGWEGAKRRAASVRRGERAALLGFGSVGFEIRLLRVSGLTVRKIAFQMLIFTAAGFLRPFGSKPAELERQIRLSGQLTIDN